MRFVAALVACAGCGRIAFDPSRDATEPYVRCEPLAPALADPAVVFVQEPVVHTDGLRLYANQIDAGFIQETTRAAPGAKFGPFAPTTSFQPYVGDMSFIEIAGVVVAFAHAPDTIRQLVYCPNPGTSPTCSRITMTDTATGTPITDDHDGPSVAYRRGELMMTFNRERAVYEARPTAPDLLAWEATQLELPEPGFPVDDPSLTADGELLLVHRVDIGGTYALRWDAGSRQYIDPILVVDPVFGPGSPAVGAQDAVSFELVVNSSSRGVLEPHHTTCTRR